MVPKLIGTETDGRQVRSVTTTRTYSIGDKFVLVEVERPNGRTDITLAYISKGKPPLDVATITVTNCFSCCGAFAVSSPWLANQRVLNTANLDVKEVVNTIIKGAFDVYDITYMVQVDRIGHKLSTVEGAVAERGRWGIFVDNYDGTITQFRNSHRNVVPNHSSVLTGIAFVNDKAMVGGTYRNYTGSYKKGTLQ